VELYREYFKTVIDRDVEKSVELRQNRETIDVLHQLLGYKIHSLTEAKQADGTLSRRQLLDLVKDWIVGQGSDPKRAHELFKIGEERLGLIVAVKGEGEDAVYGFEIQPIREYFAAAFISDQIQGNAHAVFQDLLRRTYWKEVGLFLAGLRRANEKADLVSRCKIVDQDPLMGWRQDGRAMTLQLLQEGVFSQPPHVYNEALEFLVDLLDPRRVPVQNQPKSLLNVLPALITQGEENKQIKRLSNMVSAFSQSTDDYLLYRLYYVLKDLLPSDRFSVEASKYRGPSPNITANIRLRWPAEWRKDIKKLSEKSTFWSDVSDEIWVDAIWEAFLDSNLAEFAVIPRAFHSKLVEEFAINPIPISLARPIFSGSGDDNQLAVVELLRTQKSLFDFSLTPRRNEAVPVQAYSDDRLDIRGLDEITGPYLIELIRTANKLISKLPGRSAEQAEAMDTYLKTIGRHIETPGILGWIACRCYTNLLQISTAIQFGRSRKMAERDERVNFISVLRGHPEWTSIVASAGKLFGHSGPVDVTHPQYLRGNLYDYQFGRHFNSSLIPTHVRVESESEPLMVTDLLERSICRKERVPYAWIKRIPLTPSMMRPLVAKCLSCIPELLLFCNDSRISRFGTGDPLLVQQIQRILKVTRRANDSKVLSGALIVLLDSSFLQLAGAELTLRMLAAEKGRVSVGSRLFEQRRVDPHIARTKDIVLINEVARGVMATPERFPFRTVSDAASYVADHSTLSQPSLMSEEGNFGIFFQRPGEAH